MIAAVAVVAAAGAGAASAGTPSGPGGTWGQAQLVAGELGRYSLDPGIAAMSCASPGECSAIGWYENRSDTYRGTFVIDEADGTWGSAHAIASPGNDAAADAAPIAISCASAGDCAAGGGYGTASGPAHAFVADETDGTWGKAQPVTGISGLGAGSGVVSVSCATAGNCAAVGNYTVTSGKGEAGAAFVVDEADGTWGKAQPIPEPPSATGVTGASIGLVSCGAAGYCSAAGETYDTATETESPYVVNETGGTWGNAEAIPGLAALGTPKDAAVSTMSCASAGNCSAGGFYQVDENGRYPVEAFVATETDGNWGNAEEVPGTAALNTEDHALTVSVSCWSAGNCAAAGDVWIASGRSFTTDVFVVSETDGTWGTAELVSGLTSSVYGEAASVTSLSCGAAGNCAAGGEYTDDSGDYRAFVVNETAGVWGTARQVPGAASMGSSGSEVTAVSCSAADYCSAGGYVSRIWPFSFRPFVVNEANASGTILGLSEPLQLTYGNEQLETVTVGVASTAGATPTGTVTITLGGRRACRITLVAGLGSCKPAPTSVPAGRYRLTAAYSGDKTYVNATVSWPFPIAVTKATTTTALRLSAAAVTYGHEGTEHLSVTVAPRYAGTPAGKVTVRAGRTTICVISLGKTGKGSCTLTAKQLKPGTYTLTARYGGSTDYLPSAAPGKTLTVTK